MILGCARGGLSWLVTALFIGLFTGLVCLHSTQAVAQVSDTAGLEAIRVFVPEEYVRTVVTPAYLTVRIDVLDKLLKDQAQRRSLAAAEKVGIERATYVARWNEQELSSRASLLQVGKADKSTTLNIGRISLALTEPQGVPEPALPLLRQLRYVNDNNLQILVEEQQSDFWFGFKAKPKRKDLEQQVLDLQLPPAVVGMMLLATPADTVVTSDLPCMEVTDVERFLPDSWPKAALPTLNSGEHWFAVWLSGQEKCTLTFSPLSKVKETGYSMLVASAQCDTQVTPAGMQVSSQFRLPTTPASGKLRLRLDDPLHVRSITVGGIEVSGWKTVYEDLPTESTGTDRKTHARHRMSVRILR